MSLLPAAQAVQLGPAGTISRVQFFTREHPALCGYRSPEISFQLRWPIVLKVLVSSCFFYKKHYSVVRNRTCKNEMSDAAIMPPFDNI